jgi:hypothetical protein
METQLKGAEVVYLPKKGGTWNTNAKIITRSPSQPDIPTLSDGPDAVNVYGRGFDDPTRGYVFYEASSLSFWNHCRFYSELKECFLILVFSH